MAAGCRPCAYNSIYSKAETTAWAQVWCCFYLAYLQKYVATNDVFFRFNFIFCSANTVTNSLLVTNNNLKLLLSIPLLLHSCDAFVQWNYLVGSNYCMNISVGNAEQGAGKWNNLSHLGTYSQPVQRPSLCQKKHLWGSPVWVQNVQRSPKDAEMF